MVPRREEFFQDVRRGIRFEQKPKVTTDADLLSPDWIAPALHGAARWLTAKVVAKYSPEDFLEFSESQQARLREAVEGFREATGDVPPDTNPSREQLARALNAFRTLVSAVREVVLTEWTHAVGAMLGEVEAWVDERGWRARQIERKINEMLFGSYSLPQLQVFAESDLYVFDPVARFVPGAMGAYDVAIQPSHYLTSLYRQFDGRWYAHLDGGQGVSGRRELWSRETFLETLQDLRSLV